MMLICISIFAAGCVKTKASNKPLSFSFNKNGGYTGFSDLPSKLTLEKAKDDGYLVIEGFKIYANKAVLDNFVKVSSQKENISTRIVFFDKEISKSPAYLDLYYKDGYYYLFNSTKKNEQKEQYSYLLKLDGRYPNAAVDETFVVLTNDSALTFEKIAHADFANDRKTKESIYPIRFILRLIHTK